MAIEPDVKEILDKHEDRISNLEEDVSDIKANQIKTDEQLKYMIQSQQDFKELFVQNMNAVHQNMNQLIVNTVYNNTQKEIAEHGNNTQLSITKVNNKYGLYGKLLLIFGVAFFSGSKAPAIWNAIKVLF